MSKLTQGTHIYVIDPRGSEAVVFRIQCTTAFNPGGAPKSQIDDTCLDELEAMKYRAGLAAPGQATLNINADPANQSHVDLYDLYKDSDVEELKFAIGWSDGTALPTLDSDDGFDLPTSRTWFTFNGYIADFPFDFQLNSVVSTVVSIQRNGGASWIKKVS